MTELVNQLSLILLGFVTGLRFCFRRPVPEPKEWQCSRCDHTNLVEQHLECRRCGAPREPLR